MGVALPLPDKDDHGPLLRPAPLRARRAHSLRRPRPRREPRPSPTDDPAPLHRRLADHVDRRRGARHGAGPRRRRGLAPAGPLHPRRRLGRSDLELRGAVDPSGRGPARAGRPRRHALGAGRGALGARPRRALPRHRAPRHRDRPARGGPQPARRARGPPRGLRVLLPLPHRPSRLPHRPHADHPRCGQQPEPAHGAPVLLPLGGRLVHRLPSCGRGPPRSRLRARRLHLRGRARLLHDPQAPPPAVHHAGGLPPALRDLQDRPRPAGAPRDRAVDRDLGRSRDPGQLGGRAPEGRGAHRRLDGAEDRRPAGLLREHAAAAQQRPRRLLHPAVPPPALGRPGDLPRAGHPPVPRPPGLPRRREDLVVHRLRRAGGPRAHDPRRGPDAVAAGRDDRGGDDLAAAGPERLLRQA